MKLEFTNYQQQLKEWPQKGRHILAQYDDSHVVVYQAYRPEIGLFAAENGFFGGAFSYQRMSWIKPNFLWMMYRSGWGSKSGQEVVLAIHLKRHFFESVLENAFPSTNTGGMSKVEWDRKISETNVRLQWDPDHDPYGNKVERRAIQLGLRGEFLLPFKGDGIVHIENITDFVVKQRELVQKGMLDMLETPLERVFPVSEKIKNVLDMNEGESDEKH